MKGAVLVLCGFIALAPVPAAPLEEFDFDALVKGAVEAYEKVDDYVCDFHKKERVGDRIVEEVILFKFKKPASYYMKWLASGEEAIYVEGRNDDQLLYHAGGLFNVAALAIDPRGLLAMRGNRHAITDAGLGHILGVVVDNYERGRKDPRSRFSFEGESREGDRFFLNVRAEFPSRDYYSRVILLRFDRVTGLPVWLRVEGWEGEFLEEYQFAALRLNVGLTEMDFDTRNPEYRFRWIIP